MVGLVLVALKSCNTLAVQKVAVWRQLPLPGSLKPFFPLPLFFSSSFHPFLPWWLHHVGTALSMIYTVVRGVCVFCLLTAVQLLSFSRGPEPWGCIPSPSGDSHLRAVMYPAEEETPPREPDF